MPISISTLQGIGNAYRLGLSGDSQAGSNILAKCLEDVNRSLVVMQPGEQLEVLAAAGNACVACKMWREAGSLFEQVCSLDERLEPLSIETAGDYRSLGVCYEAIGQGGRALEAFRKAHAIQLRVDAPEAFVEEVNQHIVNIEQQMQATEKQQNKTTNPKISKMLNRWRKND